MLQFLVIGLLFITILLFEKKWDELGKKIKLSNKKAILIFIPIDLVLLWLTIILKSDIFMTVFYVLLILEGFIFLLIKKSKDDNTSKLSQLKNLRPKPNKKHSRQSQDTSWFMKYIKGICTLLLVYMYLYCQTKVHYFGVHSNQFMIIVYSILQFIFFVLVSLSFGVTFKYTLKFGLFSKGLWNKIVKVLSICFIIIFVYEVALFVILLIDHNIMYSLLTHVSGINVIIVLEGVISTICLYSLLINEFIIWKYIFEKYNDKRGNNVKRKSKRKVCKNS